MWRDSCKKLGREREYPTPAPARTWRSAPCSPMQPMAKNYYQYSPQAARVDSFHIAHKVPAGDSPYVKAKQVQLIDKDPNKAISLFWSAINSGDRVDSALKDMAIVMKQLDRTEEAIEAIKSFRHLCSRQAQGSLDNVLIDLYKRAGRIEEHIQLLHNKLKLLDEGVGFGGKRTKIARSQGKRFHVSIEQERSRLLGNLAWAYMQQNNYRAAEEYYREALSLEPDKNKQCNLAVCLMQRGCVMEAKALLQAVRPSSKDRETSDSYIKSFDRAIELLSELESKSTLKPNGKEGDMKTEVGGSFSSPINMNSKSPLPPIDGDRISDRNGNKTLFFGDFSYPSAEKWKRESYFQDQIENVAKGTWFGSIFVEQENGQQLSQRHPFADKWEKESSWQSPSQRGADFKNGNWASKRGTEEEGSSSNSLNSKFGCPTSINRNSEFGSTERISREHDAANMMPAIQSFPYPPNLLTESPITVENPVAMPSQNPAEDLQASTNQLWYRRSEITLSDMRSKNVKEKNTQGATPSQNPGGDLKASINQLWDSRSETALSDGRNENVKEKNTQELHYSNELNLGNYAANQDFSIFKNGKSWADMVEEEEELLYGCKDFDTNMWEYPCQESSVSFRTPSKWVNGWEEGDFFYDENINSNIISPTPPRPPTSTRSQSQRTTQKNHMENLQQKLEFIDLKEEGRVKNTDNYSFRNPSARRALSFDQDQKKASAGSNLPSPLQKKALDFDDYSGVATMKRGNRLKVFHDITTLPDSPRSCGKDLNPERSGNRLKVFQEITHPGSLRA